MSRGGGSSSNDKIIEQQKAEAEQAKRDKFDRDQRMKYGREKIRAAFRGGKVGPYNQWGKEDTYGVRKRYVDTRTGKMYDSKPGQQTQAYVYPEDDRGYRGLFRRSRTDAGKHFKPVTQTYKTGTRDAVVQTGQTETLSGIGDDFYNDYFNTITDYYTCLLYTSDAADE